MKTLLRAAACLWLLVGLPAQAVNVVFTDAERSADGLAFHMDRAGDLYPPGNVPVNTAAMLNGDDKRPAVNLADPEFAGLKGLYRWESARNSPNWQALVRHAGITPSRDFDLDWLLIQQALRGAVVDRIDALQAPDVVLAIHGFNNTHAESIGWYQLFEADLRRRNPRAEFVRMYWDGLSYGKGPGIWGEAQYNGPGVGHQLRRILNRLRPDLPLRVFTHSSGAFVLSNALGDGTGGFDPDDLSDAFMARAGGAPGYEYPSQLEDLRIAMLVPAAPLSTFANFRQGERGAIPVRVILGTSRKDSATSKFWARCRWSGDTCMSNKPRKACAWVREGLGIDPPRLAVVDFHRPFGLFHYHGHGVDSYIEDPEWVQLVSQLFDERPELPAGTRRWCDPPLGA
ncbi:hypothetical protein [Luteimonas sp. R10]|uniref:hypothetical protein n=1 Tax=Luteimonas sp. R10 TaxID=3108176 RepID=UPI003092E78A|nr:hypothetical protein U3649_02695 [Luteimonas sp. R10]